MLELAGILLTLTAILAWVNHRFVGFPTTIGVMSVALVGSLGLVLLTALGLSAIQVRAEALLGAVDFYAVLMHGMLSLLLFAGALHVDLAELAARRWTIGVLATVGVVASTFFIGAGAWVVFDALGFGIPLAYCLVFGALISPTDPIAVLGILKSAKAPKSLEIKIVGESLFNDGVAVVVFAIALEIATGAGEPTLGHVAGLFAEEALGGVLYGLLIGYAAYRMLASVDSYEVEILITLALVIGGYALALRLHVSGPIAMVVAGLLIGNHGRMFAMSELTREHLDTFWMLVDEVLNALLFVLIGLEVILLTFTGGYVLAGVVLIPVVLAARFACVGLPLRVLERWFGREFTAHAAKILTWAGLRGGISVALALSLPPGAERELILTVTYLIVLFSILVQGLTIAPLLRALLGKGNPGSVPR